MSHRARLAVALVVFLVALAVLVAVDPPWYALTAGSLVAAWVGGAAVRRRRPRP